MALTIYSSLSGSDDGNSVAILSQGAKIEVEVVVVVRGDSSKIGSGELSSIDEDLDVGLADVPVFLVEIGNRLGSS